MSNEFSKKMKELVKEIKKNDPTKVTTYLDGFISLLGSTQISLQIKITGDFDIEDDIFDRDTRKENKEAGEFAHSIPTSISDSDIDELLQKCINLTNALKRQSGSPTSVRHALFDHKEAIKQAEEEIKQAEEQLSVIAENLQKCADDYESPDEDDKQAISPEGKNLPVSNCNFYDPYLMGWGQLASTPKNNSENTTTPDCRDGDYFIGTPSPA